MASRQHSKSRKSRNRIPTFSKRSDWAAWMNGAEPEWVDSPDAREMARVFDYHLPAWLIESEPWRPVTAVRFQSFRKCILGLTTSQCAAYLRVHRGTVCRWEAGAIAVPFSAFETLRLLYYTAAQRLSHKHWDGWFINRQTGELISPDLGRLAVKPQEINGLPNLYNRLSILECLVEKQKQQIDELQVENTALRSNEKSRQVAAELEAMQDRLSDLLTDVRTADVIEFNRPGEEARRA